MNKWPFKGWFHKGRGESRSYSAHQATLASKNIPADAERRGNLKGLDFFATFFIKKKSREKREEKTNKQSSKEKNAGGEGLSTRGGFYRIMLKLSGFYRGHGPMV